MSTAILAEISGESASMLTSKTAKAQGYIGSIETVWSWLKWHWAKNNRLHFLYAAALCGLTMWFGDVCPKMDAQTAHYVGVPAVDISGTTLHSPFGASVSSSGEAYIGDQGNSRILQLTPSTGLTSTAYQYNATTDPGCGQPVYPSVDSNGNVYFTCGDTTQVYKVPLNSGAFGTATLLSTQPNGTGGRGTVIDSSNNLWVVELNNNSNQYAYILKCTTSGSCSTYYNFQSGSSLGQSYNVQPYALAEDSSGNFYIGDVNNKVVWKLSNTGTASSPVAGTLTSIQSCPPASGEYSNSGGCYGIAVSASGVVYMSSNGPYIYKLTPNGSGGYISSTVYPPPGLLHRSVGIALDPTGTILYAADYTDNNQSLSNGLTGPSTASTNFVQFAASGQGFGSVPVGSTGSTTLSLTFSIDTTGTLGNIAVLTQGIAGAGLDFANAGTGTCLANHNYTTAPVTCTVNVTFTPTKAGLRQGAVELLNSSGTPIATALVFGTGTGPQVNFTSVAQKTVDTLPTQSEGLVSDTAGNLYITGGTALYKETCSGSPCTYTQSTLASSASGTNFSALQGLAIDGAGNLYLGDGGNGRIIKETLSGGTYTPTVICSSGCGANQVAVDLAGNVYFLSGATNAVDKLTYTVASNGTVSYTGPTSIQANSNNPWGIAVDTSGNIFYTGEGNGTLYELTASGSGYVQTTLDSSLTGPQSIALDGLGNIYVAQTSGVVAKETYSSGTTYTKSNLMTLSGNAVGVWVDNSGNVFATNFTGDLLAELPYGTPPSLSFSSTSVGSTSTSQTVTIQNVGNAALTFPIPSSGNTNPAVSTNFGWTTIGGSACPALTSSSGSAGTLAAGSTCNYPIYFAPVSGTSDTGTFVITDNSASGTTQTINLSGTASYPSAPTVTGVSPNSGTLAGGVTVTITGTNLLGATSVSFGGTAAAITSISSTQVVVTSPAVSSPGTIDVQVTTPNSTSATSSSDHYVNTKATKTITFPQPATPALQGAVATLSATASNGDAVTFSIVGGTGSATLNGSQITYTGAGTVIIEADSASTSTYFAASAVQQTVTVNALTLSSLTASSTSNTTSSPAIVGEPVQVTVVAIDSQNQTQDAYFTGTVTLSCGGCSATLPGAYTYQLSDAGSHAFSVTFNARGTYTITATSGSVSTTAQVKASDAVWVLNAAGTLSKLNGGGTGVTTGIGTSGTAAGYGGAAFDSSGNAWSVSNASNTLYFATYTGTGATSYTGGGLNGPSSVAVDGLGYVWVANKTGNTVSEFTNAGVAQSSSNGYGSSYSSGDTLNSPSWIAIDQTGGVWVANKTGNTVTHIFGAAAPVVTPLATATANGTQGTRP